MFLEERRETGVLQYVLLNFVAGLRIRYIVKIKGVKADSTEISNQRQTNVCIYSNGTSFSSVFMLLCDFGITSMIYIFKRLTVYNTK